jgi:O-acetyl-ADP-ribose deacetylase (regulator of RNase III)
VSRLARCMACEQLLVAAGAPGSWRRVPLTAADETPGSDSWIARQAVKTMHEAAASTPGTASTAVRAGKTKVSGGMSCGVGGFQPPTAEEMAAMPQMEFDDQGLDAAPAEAAQASAAAAAAPIVQREADGGLRLQTG